MKKALVQLETDSECRAAGHGHARLVNRHLRSGQLGLVASSLHNLASCLPLSASSLAARRGIVQWSMWRNVGGYLDVPQHHWHDKHAKPERRIPPEHVQPLPRTIAP